jgi:hypothetical protein
MTKKLLALLVLTVFVAGISYSCKKKETATEEEVAVEESGESEGEGEAGEGEGEEEAESGGGGGACDAYAKCCEAYVKALEGVQGMPETALTAAKDGCKQIENLKSLPTAEAGCKSAMDAMKQGADAYKAMPGFKFPSECE